jgi:hypothetical protein
VRRLESSPAATSDTYTVQRAIDEFSFGLERVLEGIGALVRRSGEPR